MLRLREHETVRPGACRLITLHGNRLQCKNLRFLCEHNSTLHLCLLIKLPKNLTWGGNHLCMCSSSWFKFKCRPTGSSKVWLFSVCSSKTSPSPAWLFLLPALPSTSTAGHWNENMRWPCSPRRSLALWSFASRFLCIRIYWMALCKSDVSPVVSLWLA